MKTTIIKSILGVGLLSLLFTGCGSKQPVVKTMGEITQNEAECVIDGVEAPKWTCNPYLEGYITAVGIAQMNAGNDKSLQRTEALGSGRDAIGQEISVKVNNLFKNYAGTTGTGETKTYDSAKSMVSKQLSSVNLKGSKGVQYWSHPKTKELYVLVAVPTKNIVETINKEVKTSFRDKEAQYQRFLAEQNQKELEKELEK